MESVKLRMMESCVRFLNRREGQGFVEYLFIIGLVGLGLTAALIAFRGQLSTALSTVGAGV